GLELNDRPAVCERSIPSRSFDFHPVQAGVLQLFARRLGVDHDLPLITDLDDWEVEVGPELIRTISTPKARCHRPLNLQRGRDADIPERRLPGDPLGAASSESGADYDDGR